MCRGFASLTPQLSDLSVWRRLQKAHKSRCGAVEMSGLVGHVQEIMYECSMMLHKMHSKVQHAQGHHCYGVCTRAPRRQRTRARRLNCTAAKKSVEANALGYAAHNHANKTRAGDITKRTLTCLSTATMIEMQTSCGTSRRTMTVRRGDPPESSAARSCVQEYLVVVVT